MKLNKVIIFLCILATLKSLACPGCMDNSWHLARPFDTKEYHPVECNCECRKLNIARGECLDCGHKHFFEPQYIIRRPGAQKTVTGWRKIPSCPCH